MAHRLQLTSPFRGMTHIWNVDSSVGTESTDVNKATDVRLVSLMTHCMWSIPDAGSQMAAGCRTGTEVVDAMNQGLGFMIYYMQVEQKKPADGTVSPSPKWPSDQYLIVRINYILYNNLRTVWETLPDHMKCGARLKAELAVTR